MTLMELLIGSGLMIMMATVLFSVALGASRIAANVDSGASVFSRGRVAFENMHADIARADSILARYPPTGTAAYASNGTTTLIARLPQADANGSSIPDAFDIVIYHLEPATGRTGPNQLVRYRSQMTGGSPSSIIRERVLATNVESLAFNYVGVDSFVGNSLNKTFTLKATPGASSGVQANQVMVGGVDRISDGHGQYMGATLIFALAPKTGVSIDAIYNADPTAIINASGSNPASFVHVTLRVRTPVRNAANATNDRFIELSSRSPVRNR